MTARPEREQKNHGQEPKIYDEFPSHVLGGKLIGKSRKETKCVHNVAPCCLTAPGSGLRQAATHGRDAKRTRGRHFVEEHRKGREENKG